MGAVVPHSPVLQLYLLNVACTVLKHPWLLHQLAGMSGFVELARDRVNQKIQTESVTITRGMTLTPSRSWMEPGKPHVDADSPVHRPPSASPDFALPNFIT